MKKTFRFIRTARRYSSRHSTTAIDSPTAAPMIGPVDSPAAVVAVQKNSAVSRPSRATAKKVVRASAPAPSTRAWWTLPPRSPERFAAVRDIQKIIAVTTATAKILSTPPTRSRPRPSSELVVELRTAAKLADTVTAPSHPSQTGAVGRRTSAAKGGLVHRGEQDTDDQTGFQAFP